MEAWENKIIADKLNSLQDLPEGYVPNISSKWEIIQSGMQTNRKKNYFKWWLGLGLLLFAGVTVWLFLLAKEPVSQEASAKQIVEKKAATTHLAHRQFYQPKHRQEQP
ncbi:MAG TPA: hypothetical protein VMR70_09430 [Flavisolibacter sp.]|nr:hypothetical protein [Flavisolibacter sp.]